MKLRHHLLQEAFSDTLRIDKVPLKKKKKKKTLKIDKVPLKKKRFYLFIHFRE